MLFANHGIGGNGPLEKADETKSGSLTRTILGANFQNHGKWSCTTAISPTTDAEILSSHQIIKISSFRMTFHRTNGVQQQ